MPVWVETSLNLVVGALTLALLLKYRDRGILKRIGNSKLQFRAWLAGKAK
jgi:hypothetical protein